MSHAADRLAFLILGLSLAIAYALGVQAQKNAVIIAQASITKKVPKIALHLALVAASGAALGAGVLFARRRARRPVRCENDLIGALGSPLLAARPFTPEALEPLCRQLLEHWFTRKRRLLAIASPNPGDGRSRLAAELARGFARLGVSTLLIDADLRSPAQHRLFNLPNRWGLAGFLAGGAPKPAACTQKLSVLFAGTSSADPLELLSSPRLGALLKEAAQHFEVVLIDTPAAARGPDFEIFAAHAGGALVLARKDAADAASLERLKGALKRCSARLVATVLKSS
jgi:capsular exopolysaccharide synthesis family protein